MAATYELIASNTLSSAAADVTFSAIPNTFTDLVLRMNTRSDTTSTTFRLYFNGNSSTSNYSFTQMNGNGSTAGSGRSSNASNALVGALNTTGDTSSTFSSTEIYIPNYTASQNKPFDSFSARETNATAAAIYGIAALFRDTTAISSITIYVPAGGNLASGSSFFLYGIKNS